MPVKAPKLLKDARLTAVVPKGDLCVNLTEFGWVARGGLPEHWRPAVTLKAFPAPVDPAELAEVVSGFGPLTFTLGPISVGTFAGRDVLYVEAVSPAAFELNWLLSGRYGWGGDAGGYVPRLEVATVRDDRVRRLSDDLRFINASFEVDALTLLVPRRAAHTVQL